MEESDAVIMPDEQELAAGFSAQTLSYPDTYELPKLGGSRKNRLERAVALEIDVGNRIKRCRGREGYVHEVLDGDEWREHWKFTTLSEVLNSDIYGIYLRKEQETGGCREECD